jgi:hypothetical protein
MPDDNDKVIIIKRVQDLLSAAKPRGIHLQLTGYRLDDGWLYLVVEPTQKGERASQHAHLMTEIERTLQKEGFDQVLLVPAVPEHAGLTDVPPPSAA